MKRSLPKSRFSNDKAHIETKELNSITIPSAQFTHNSELEGYYLDMREAFKQYESGIFGDFDEKGVPMVGWGKNAYYSPVNIAQYGFILHTMYLEHKSEEIWDVLDACLKQIETNEVHEERGITWRDSKPSVRYNTGEHWASAMIQGECLSFYLRMYQLTQNSLLLEKAHRIFDFMFVPFTEGGVYMTDEEGNVWLEEYPSEPQSKVLNGFVYALFGVYDYYRVTQSEKAKKLFDAGVLTLEKNMKFFDAGYWSYYDLYRKELVKYYYQKNVHTPQLEALYKITQKEVFNTYAVKWKRTVNPINYIFVQVMYRVLPRFRKFKSKLK
jgi:heparosan-N-sulfate-glucuronate 5-epimerase